MYKTFLISMGKTLRLYFLLMLNLRLRLSKQHSFSGLNMSPCVFGTNKAFE